VFAGIFIASAYSTYQVIDKISIMKNFIQVIIITSFFFNMTLLTQNVSEKFPVVIGLETREQYLDRRVNLYSTIDYANRNLGNSVKILTMDPRGYHFDKPYVVGAKVFQGYIRFDEINDISQLLSMLRSHGITHILLKEDTDKSVFIFWDELKSYMTLLYSRNGYQLYKLIFSN
jgi:hypothetical protein